jgi:hypothetical protein
MVRLKAGQSSRIAALAALAVVAACDGMALTAPCEESEGTECTAGSVAHAAKIEHFVELALSGGRIYRWSDAVAVEVVGGTSSDRESVRAAAARLSDASGHPMRLVTEGGSLVVRIVPRAEFGRYISGASPKHSGACSPQFRGDGTIFGGTIIVAAELPAQERARVILHEMAHSLGLLGHSSRYSSSVLFPTISRRTTILEQDRFALRSLYQAEMAPGFTTAEALDVLGLSP